ncbi:hypothetical protein DAPPUDRAFT_311696 [Daphnia pulex]|uniref:Uncharacterized protein n=1 Tax=Daphnia pulex TaxID=6669 RepID=E9FXM7_DAPPU|nr:hypothetical protein DAPPUDRAFT_311696 [Daphnia pulex]|eukprot:EFX88117.1 hypothetical protein DAPPUDRAFT_311696 [Daphnia pulex]
MTRETKYPAILSNKALTAENLEFLVGVQGNQSDSSHCQLLAADANSDFSPTIIILLGVEISGEMSCGPFAINHEVP